MFRLRSKVLSLQFCLSGHNVQNENDPEVSNQELHCIGSSASPHPIPALRA